MIYKINKDGELLIYNDLGYPIFVITKDNCWGKYEYGQNHKTVYYEDYTGYSINYDI